MEQQQTSKNVVGTQRDGANQQAQMKQHALRMLETYFGYTSFRPAQEAPIASLLRNEDVIGIMPTGAVSYERSGGWSFSAEHSCGAHQ